jgi:hypothetical protein
VIVGCLRFSYHVLDSLHFLNSIDFTVITVSTVTSAASRQPTSKASFPCCTSAS